MSRTKGLDFNLDCLEWHGGVSDIFFETPLGILSKPLKIEEIAEVEWTIVGDNFITIVPIDQSIQLRYWLKVPEMIRIKIKNYSEEIFPFTGHDIKDRYLIAYSVESPEKKYIGFTFETLLKTSKAPLYVYTQAKINSEKEAKVFLEDYLYEIYQRDLNKIEPEDYKPSFFQKIKNIFSK